MFDILEKYKETEIFNFKPSDNLKLVCNAPNNKAGIYLMFGFTNNVKSLLYIGCSGHIKNDGSLSIRKTGLGGIKGRIVNGHQFGKVKRHISIPLQMKQDNIDLLEIQWFVTHNSIFIDSPVFVESNLLQNYLNQNKKLPKWNQKF